MSNVDWKEKQELLFMQSDVDSSEIESGCDERTQFPEKPSAGARLLRTATAITIGCAVGFLVVQIISRGLLRSHIATGDGISKDGIFKVSSQFRGVDGVGVQQHVTSVVADNYVMYHVVKPLESAWIIDDFEKSVQIMKMESKEEGNICYVAHLNKSHSTTPDLYGFQEQSAEPVDGISQRVQTTFYADEMQLEELTHLGNQAMELCSGTPTFWIYPITEKMMNAAQTESRHRDKRNVRKCMTSCCTMVCCCNQAYLQWQQKGQKVNCRNICRGCTPLSHSITLKVC